MEYLNHSRIWGLSLILSQNKVRNTYRYEAAQHLLQSFVSLSHINYLCWSSVNSKSSVCPITTDSLIRWTLSVKTTPMCAVQHAARQLYILGVLGSNLGPNTGHPPFAYRNFLPSPGIRCRDSTWNLTTTGFIHILSKSAHHNHPSQDSTYSQPVFP